MPNAIWSPTLSCITKLRSRQSRTICGNLLVSIVKSNIMMQSPMSMKLHSSKSWRETLLLTRSSDTGKTSRNWSMTAKRREYTQRCPSTTKLCASFSSTRIKSRNYSCRNPRKLCIRIQGRAFYRPWSKARMRLCTTKRWSSWSSALTSMSVPTNICYPKTSQAAEEALAPPILIFRQTALSVFAMVIQIAGMATRWSRVKSSSITWKLGSTMPNSLSMTKILKSDRTRKLRNCSKKFNVSIMRLSNGSLTWKSSRWGKIFLIHCACASRSIQSSQKTCFAKKLKWTSCTRQTRVQGWTTMIIPCKMSENATWLSCLRQRPVRE